MLRALVVGTEKSKLDGEIILDEKLTGLEVPFLDIVSTQCTGVG